MKAHRHPGGGRLGEQQAGCTTSMKNKNKSLLSKRLSPAFESKGEKNRKERPTALFQGRITPEKLAASDPVTPA